MVLLFSMITELMEKGKSSGIHHILILTLLILILIERLAANKSFMYTAVLDLIHPVLEKSVPLSFVTQCDVKPFVF